MRFFHYANCIPTQLPDPPSPELLSTLDEEQREKVFSSWEKDCETTMDKNHECLRNALPRIKLCAFLHGLLDPYAGEQHYTWCPFPAWKNREWAGEWSKAATSDHSPAPKQNPIS